MTSSEIELPGGVRGRPLAVEGAWEFAPPVHGDARGVFVSPYQEPAFVEAVGHPLPVVQTNQNRSAAGVIRGVHFVLGQEKLVHCSRGRALDLVVDLRVGSPTFGAWDAVEMDDESFRALYFPPGTGHAFAARADDTVMSYLVSTSYDPEAERTVHPLDAELALPWPAGADPILSARDRDAPTLRGAAERGLLPHYPEVPHVARPARQ
ncbi:dTDP-4-dehydrorhamnose 3,5-epimerase [Pseudonocardia nematodicida]|uniref:dTDP-4-dehydrorhamnose 3,5-epimerase n=1 Tax=Pseudonocardia nematodicida TaxID=1206997 RepID=A0ABV1K6P7_9PSEU